MYDFSFFVKNILTVEQLFNYNKIKTTGGDKNMGTAKTGCDCCEIHKEVVAQAREKMLAEKEFLNISDFFGILGDSTRIKILWALDSGEMCVCDIAVLISMTKSAVSHQLKVLKDNRLVKCRRQGKNVYYSLSDDHIKDIIERAVEHLYE